jgi:hypothetical protein
MIIVNRLYTVLSVILIILVTVFYLIYLPKYDNEYVLYLQSNSSNSLQNTIQYKELMVLNSSTSSYNLNVGKVYLDYYSGYTRTGRFNIVFSSPGSINFKVVTDKGVDIGKYTSQSLIAYYPIYVEFHAPSDTKWIQLQYSTTLQTVAIYKISIEFY